MSHETLRFVHVFSLRLVYCLLPGLLGICFRVDAQTTALVGASVVDVRTGAILKNHTVLVEDGRITALGASRQIQVPEGATVIDAAGKWMVPGYIDAHVHFFQSGGLYTRPDILDLGSVGDRLANYRPYDEERAWILDRLPRIFAQYLACGVTGAVDMGGPYTNFKVRADAEASDLAPTLAVTGPLISTYQPDAFQITDPPIIKAETAEAARALVRQQLPHKPDFIKIWYIASRGLSAEENFPLVQATVEEAHEAGLRVAVHATELATARLALRAGADILVHSVDDAPVDEALIETIKARDVLYIPTLMVRPRYQEVFSQRISFTYDELMYGDPFAVGSLYDLKTLPREVLPPRVAKWMASEQDIAPSEFAMDNLRRLQEAGVTIATGTDAGNIGTLHGGSFSHELALMAEAGMTPEQILRASTLNAARVMGREAELGTLEVGKQADLLLLNANPLKDVAHHSDIHLVMKNGRPMLRDTILDYTPVEVVQVQLNGYNARHLEAFMETYADSVRIYNHPDELRYTGHAEMAPVYDNLFESVPQLHCEITERIEQGQFVIDHERVQGRDNGRTIRAVAIYKVDGPRISHVWFVR